MFELLWQRLDKDVLYASIEQRYLQSCDFFCLQDILSEKDFHLNLPSIQIRT